MNFCFRNWRKTRRAVCFAALVAGAVFAIAPTPATSAERTGINLGTTSFFDGFGGLAPGCAYIQYVGHNVFDTYNGPDGNTLNDWHLKSTYVTPQIACTTDVKIAGSSLGWTVLVPMSGQSASPITSNGYGLGDMIFGAYLAFSPVMSGGKPVFAHGIELDIITPTGKFDSNKTINPGNHYWSVVPFYKATWLFAPKWELSGRFNYIHNFDHSINGITRHTGEGFWVNFTASYEVVKDFHLGLNGYWLQQTESDSIGGVDTANSKQESLYIGPGFMYRYDPKNVFNFNVYLPVTDKNTFSDSVQVNLQYIHPF
jgi:hypothetical protein